MKEVVIKIQKVNCGITVSVVRETYPHWKLKPEVWEEVLDQGHDWWVRRVLGRLPEGQTVLKYHDPDYDHKSINGRNSAKTWGYNPWGWFDPSGMKDTGSAPTPERNKRLQAYCEVLEMHRNSACTRWCTYMVFKFKKGKINQSHQTPII